MDSNDNICKSYDYSMQIHNNSDIKFVNKNVVHKMYLYDNFYEDNNQIVTMFKNNGNNCKNPLVNEFKHIFEHILSSKIQTMHSNIIILTNDYIVQSNDNEWVAVVFLNSNIQVDNGLAFMQENFNSNNKIQHKERPDYSGTIPLIIEDFFYGKPNRIIIFNSVYYHKLIVKMPMLVEIICIKLEIL